MNEIASTLLAAALLSACGVTVGPSKPTHGPVALRTAESPVPASACAPTVAEGTLVEASATGLGLLDDSGGTTKAVIWPHAWWASPSIGGSLLVNASGDVVASTGDRVRIEAIELSSGLWLVCGNVERVPEGV